MTGCNVETVGKMACNLKSFHSSFKNLQAIKQMESMSNGTWNFITCVYEEFKVAKGNRAIMFVLIKKTGNKYDIHLAAVNAHTPATEGHLIGYMINEGILKRKDNRLVIEI